MSKIAINGFGRIGRAVYRALGGVDVVAINDLTDKNNLEYLLQYDSAHGRFEGDLERVKFLSEKDPAKLPWDDIDLVLECTGFFTDKEGASKHLEAGAKSVIISANGKGVSHIVLGVNEDQIGDEPIIASCSCTTNAAAPVMKVLNDEFGVNKAHMLTVHAVTSSQRLVDGPHKDWRRGRSALNNIIPTTTGSDEAVERVLPELKGKVSASAIRVPVIAGSILEVVADIGKEVSKKEVNEAFRNAESIACSETPLVSTDIIGTKEGAIVDLASTQVIDNLVKVMVWYDNEAAYGHRLASLAQYILDTT